MTNTIKLQFQERYPAPVDWLTVPDMTQDQFLRGAYAELFDMLEGINIPATVETDGVFPIHTVTITMAEKDFIAFKMAGFDELNFSGAKPEWITLPDARRLTHVGPTPEQAGAILTRVLQAAHANTFDPDNEVTNAHRENALAMRGAAQ